jgi:hypothetical protein
MSRSSVTEAGRCGASCITSPLRPMLPLADIPIEARGGHGIQGYRCRPPLTNMFKPTTRL